MLYIRLTINGTGSTFKVNQSFSSLFQDPVLCHLFWICPHRLGYNSIAFTLVLDDSSHPCTNGDLLLYQSESLRSYTSTVLQFQSVIPSRSPCDSGMPTTSCPRKILLYVLLVLEDETRYWLNYCR